MTAGKGKSSNRITIHHWRRTVQWLFFALMFCVPMLNAAGFTQVIGTYYSLTIGGLEIVDPALAVQVFLISDTVSLPLLTAIIVPVLIALVAGKVFCSWVCPYNLFAEYLDHLRKRLRLSPALIRSTNPNKYTAWLPYGMILFIMVVTGIPLIVFLSFPGILSGQVADFVYHGVVGVELALLGMILFLDVVLASRGWCRFLCPVGVTLSLFHTQKSLRVVHDPRLCVGCTGVKSGPCQVVCPLRLSPRQAGIYPTCYNCFECVATCNRYNRSLSIAFLSRTTFRNNYPVRMLDGSHR
jgi:ferredoxin-type protein NapH